jgi:hypothetical protein
MLSAMQRRFRWFGSHVEAEPVVCETCGHQNSPRGYRCVGRGCGALLRTPWGEKKWGRRLIFILLVYLVGYALAWSSRYW